MTAAVFLPNLPGPDKLKAPPSGFIERFCKAEGFTIQLSRPGRHNDLSV